MPLGPAKLENKLISVYKNSYTLSPSFIGAMLPGQVRGAPSFLKPIESVNPDYGPLMTGGVPVANLAPVQYAMLERLTTAIAQAAFGNGSTTEDLFRDTVVNGKKIAGVMTIRQFMALSGHEQLAVINQAWEKVCTKKAYNKFVFQMDEPQSTVVAAATQPVPSGTIPTRDGQYKAGHVNASGVPDAFTGLGVGFRVDGSGPNCQRDIDRVIHDGMTTQLQNRYLMYTIKGWEVQGTVVDLDTSAPRVWSTKKDLFNESAVCIARNLYGATAFPAREFEGDAVLWATDVSGLVGFDTEQYQQTLEGNKQWRPGEKAFCRIPSGNVIGYVKFKKLGAPAAGGWKFQIPPDARWKLLPGWEAPLGVRNIRGRTDQVRDYITAQLEAWRGVEHTITGAYDFA